MSLPLGFGRDRSAPEGSSEAQGRIRVLSVLTILLFASYSSYLFFLQVVRGNVYRDRATSIARQTSVIPAQRGEIYDRDYSVPLVLNTDSFAVDLVPASVPADRREDLFARLAGALGIRVEEVKRKVPPSYYHLYQSIEILGSVPYATVAALAERKSSDPRLDEFPGVSWRSKPVRNYLETGSLSHVIGYVGDITKDELKLYYNQGYKSGDVIGKSGIEKQYDKSLRGQEGREYRIVDVKGKSVASETRRVDPPVTGSNLVLTIDAKLQTLAEKALGQRMGSAIVLKPATGEILALVSYPWYNPNLFSGSDAGNEYAKLLADPNNPLINRAIQSSYPPASTFKTVLTAGILEEKAFPVDKKIVCLGDISYGDRVFHCWTKRPGHGWLDLKGALAQSCDIYFWTVGRDYLGVERIVTYAKEFGYGKKTGIDLPGENDEGFVPTPQWKERRFHEKWLGGDTMNLSIGQGFMLVTPLQVADMVAMIVNDGIVYKPHLLKEVRDPATSAIIRESQAEVIARSRVSKETFAALREDLRGVVTEGSARFPVSTKAVAVAGKTGTAEVGLKDRWHSWFAAFGPYGAADPEDVIVVVVMVEASNPWEWWAPYASNIIFQGRFAGQSYDEAVDTLGLRYLIPRQDRVE
ncbi:MAG TPA: penicillin-binding protein 2 [Spirochaetia bacterium]|nr:penicillin-binding protein 2 [Spirochaetia bacterium]